MTDDMLQWADTSLGVGKVDGGELVSLSQPPPAIPDPRLNKPRHRPNNGRKRRYIGPFLEEPPWGVLRETGYPVPPDLRILHRVPPSWRSGPAWKIWRTGVFAMWGTECHLCGHDRADTADHLVPLSKWGNQPYDPRISRPAHGIHGCPTCKLKCNSSRGNKLYATQVIKYKPVIEL